MLDFKIFKTAVEKQMAEMSEGELFLTDVSKDELWDTYLNSFPPGTNPMYKERTEYDCQSCKQFIRAAGNIVTIKDNKVTSIWDIDIGGPFQVVADALSVLVKYREVRDIFRYIQKDLGVDHNHSMSGDGETITTWNHFHFELPKKFVKRGESVATVLSEARSGKDVFKRALDEISIDAIETVLDLIAENVLYRGEENQSRVAVFLEYKNEYVALANEHKDNYCWDNSAGLGSVSRIRNTAIGTLLVDVSDDRDLDEAVRSFERKVAPANFKRNSAIVSKRQTADAEKDVDRLGYKSALPRRYATPEDVTVNNALYTDRTTTTEVSAFDEIANEISEDISKMNRAEEVSLNTFFDSILPTANSIELLVENCHSSNLMSLIAPVNATAKGLFKWSNNFSWAYNGEVTDSIKEKVKQAGGNVEGVLRCSLSWFNYDDLDIHLIEPDGNHIYFGHRYSRTSASDAILDVDMNVSPNSSRTPVENITWANGNRIIEGSYSLYVHNYTPRENIDVGFDAEIEFGGVIHTFHYDKKVTQDVQIAKFHYSREDGISFYEGETLPNTQASKQIWNLATQRFHKVSMIMQSPNYWDGKAIGNKHLFFMLDGCKNDKPSRGFFNEFLNDELHKHRKVFERLGSKMKTERADNQLSGLGFSSTQRNHVFCRVTGDSTRVIKLMF